MIRTLTVRRLAIGRLLPTDLFFWLKALLLALVAFQAANLFWVIATPVGPLGDWRPTAPRFLSPEAQTAVLAAVDPFSRTSASPASAAA